jgi:rhodanese-related sulfurtransferase
VVHCQSGARSLVAIGALRAHGFRDVRHLAGDLETWTADGRPTRETRNP